ncbi:hypothetical protein ACFFW8_14235 [Erwinia tracheiphila]
MQWQLASADAPLKAGNMLPTREENLSALIERAQQLAGADNASLALVVGGIQNETVGFALFTPDGCWGQRVKISLSRYDLKTRQDVVAMIALNMLRCWLNGLDLTVVGQGWIEVVESLSQPC